MRPLVLLLPYPQIVTVYPGRPQTGKSGLPPQSFFSIAIFPLDLSIQDRKSPISLELLAFGLTIPCEMEYDTSDG